jgi:two-component system, cell cycle sensor histidine kinase and response regulator CckA
VRDMEGVLRAVAGEGIESTLELAAGESCIAVDRGDLERVLVNLITNARDAMPQGGRLTVRTLCTSPGRVVIEIADSGEGMSPEVRSRIFDPFFTTKPKDKGTGLGLSIVLRIVQGAGGEIAVDSVPGLGTVFRLLFHATDERPLAVAPRERLAR